MGFVKLDTKILDSSIWVEDPSTKVCWISLLCMANPDGLVESALPGIARRASISLEEAEKALTIFEKPDRFSKNLAHEGRRIERVNGGYKILNFEFYRKKDYSSYERVRRFRERHKEAKAAPASPPKQKGTRKDIDVLADYLLKTLHIPLSDRSQTKALVQSFGLQAMLDAVDRMKVYFDNVKANRWTEYVIGRHWRNLYEKLEYFSSDENLQNKLRETARGNSTQQTATPSDRKRPGETQEQYDRRRDAEITGGIE